jgi:hypothetical protein
MRIAVGVVVVVLLCGAGEAIAAPTPLGHPCLPHAGVRLCATQTLEDRVPSFDGMPLDVDVTLPATGDGPYPTVVLLHGLSGKKAHQQTADPKGGDRLTNVWYAARGYAVVNLSDRGHDRSCGSLENRSGNCDKGWLHLADQRFEVRDVQYLLGLLVDQGIADPRALGSAGCSYGSVITTQLALLRDRIRLRDGRYAPWTSPKGTPLSLAAGYAQCTITSWVATLGPNGRMLDYTDPAADQDRHPVGVLKASVASGAVALFAAGHLAPPLLDPTADFTRWIGTAVAQPPDGIELGAVIDELSGYHQAMGIDISHTTPAPLLIQNGWADDYTPPEAGGLRLYRYLRARDPDANIALQFTDSGHQRSKGKRADAIAQHTQGSAFFDHYLRGIGRPPAPGSVTAYTQRCPASSPSDGPFTAPSWNALHPGEVRFGDAADHTITDLSADPVLDAQIDPAVTTPCAAYAASDVDGITVVRHPVTKAFTVLGLPTIDLDVVTTGRYGRLIARLWDETPDGNKVLVTPARARPDRTCDVPAVRGRVAVRARPRGAAGARRRGGAVLQARRAAVHRAHLEPPRRAAHARAARREGRPAQRPPACRALPHVHHREAGSPRAQRRRALRRTHSYAARRAAADAAAGGVRPAGDRPDPVPQRRDQADLARAVRAGVEDARRPAAISARPAPPTRPPRARARSMPARPAAAHQRPRASPSRRAGR